MASTIKNTADLRALLLESIDGVRQGKVDPRQAQAISALSSRILQSARLDLDVAKMEMVHSKASRPNSVSLLADSSAPIAKQAPAKRRVAGGK